MIKNNHILAIYLIVAFILIAYIAYLAPMHSDDFSYYNMGLQWQAHINHYNSWSGRFLADYISPMLLMSPKIISSAIIGIAAVSMIFFISFLPALTFKQNYSYKSFIVLFMIYWLANPTLGQTIFWVVGAANYLFTNLTIVLYLLFFVLYIQKPSSIIQYILLLIISALVGFSSENTTWIIFLFSLISSIYLFKKNNDKKIFISLILVFISFYLMIFSPGNLSRANSPAFIDFYSIGFVERIINFIIYRVPTALVRLLPIIVPMLLLLLIAYKNNLPKKQIIIFYILCLTGLLSLGSMVLSPTLTYRSLSGPFLFLLFSCGILIQFIFTNPINKLAKLLNLIVIILGLFFALSYALITHSYSKLYAQEQIILSEIETTKTETSFILPEYYYIPSLRDRDSHDHYTNAQAMSEYHKVKNIELVKVYFDFSNIHTKFIPTLHKEIFTKISLTPLGLFSSQGTNIILESNILLDNLNDELTLKITSKQKNDTEIISIPLRTIILDQRYLIGITSKYKVDDIQKIYYSTSKTGQEEKDFKLIYQEK